MSRFTTLYTEEGQNLPDIPWNVYPRPQMKRDSFLCLNGEWDFKVIKNSSCLESVNQKIIVPFSPETVLSKIGVSFDESEYDCFVYTKEFSLTDGFNKGRVLLHFDAVSNYSQVKINGHILGTHNGGYDPFCFDITEYLEEQNVICVEAKNYLNDRIMPYGKQCRKRGGMWYTETSGIWQSVWLESVSVEYITDLDVNADKNRIKITAQGINEAKVYVTSPEGVLEFDMHKGVCEFALENVTLWSPENPYLYYYCVETDLDRVESYFAIRTLEIKNIDGYERLCLNGKPYFFHGLLDQGYWSDGGMTPPSPYSYTKDIMAMKSLGFNMLRKHIKIEPQYFYYECDRLGMIVFQDMINNGKYSFIRDTALPTLGVKCLGDRYMHRDKTTRKMFVSYMEKTVGLLKKFPSICCWTIFNEGWGQFCGTEMYHRLKKLDDTRFIDTASGWFSKVESDVDSQHVYFRKVKLRARKNPLVLSEFGGYSYRIIEHCFNQYNEYGYGKFKSRQEFVKAFCNLYTNEILPLIEKGLCAAVYTQVSDVEDETNGLVTCDRRVLKVLPEEFLHISKQLKINY